MPGRLTDRQLRSLKKANENKERRRQLKELQAQQAQQRALGRRRPPRQRDWSDHEDGHAAIEKMRPARQAARPAPAVVPAAPSPKALGTVIEVRSGDSLVSIRGQTVSAVLPPSGRVVDPDTRSPLAVGDRVYLKTFGGSEVRILAVQPRRSAFLRRVYDPSRRDPITQGQVLAANIDQVVIVCSPAEPPFRPRLIDRYLVAAARDGLPAVICLNKTDLGVADGVEASLRGYERLGAGIVRTSAQTGDGVRDARRAIAGKVSLFTGHSGVGKSSLLNALEPGLALRVGQVTQAAAGQGKGRHTTSSARLVPLSLPETFVVDTPGIRAFGIKGLAPRELAAHFADIAALAGGCSYRDCLHRGEPECAVVAAAQDEPFLRARLDSYRAMLLELG